MEYYNPNDNSAKCYAAIVAVAVLALFIVILHSVTISINPVKAHDLSSVVIVDVDVSEEAPVEKPEIEEKEKKKEVIHNVAKGHQHTTKVNVKNPSPANTEPTEEPKSEEVNGKAEETRTTNPSANFDPTQALSTERVSMGNRSAKEGDEEKRKGDGSGYSLEGADQLDSGLQNRGLSEALPQPEKNYNVAGIVAIRVKVSTSGSVTHAEYSLSGSNTQDSVLIELALEAARKAMFVKSDMESEGIITYKFELD